MWLNTVRFCSILFTALAMGAALAHLYELPNKINLSEKEYHTVQQIYRGWSLLGIVVIAALIFTLVLVIMVRNRQKLFALTLAAFLGLAGTQAIFWTLTFPVNRQTRNWTQLPDDWMKLRKQWEFSHAAGACLNLLSFIALILSVLPHEE